ncbi:MAG: SurA N-terminal domain-containing protein [Pseudomonadota bacterium]
MLMRMRSTVAKIVTFMLFGLLIASFAVWGIGDIFHTGGPNQVVAEVGHTEVPQYDFSRNLSRQMNQVRRQLGGEFDISQARAIGLVDQVLQQMVSQALFNEQANKMGLVVGDSQIQQLIMAEPAFKNQAGIFDRSRYFGLLQNNGWTEQRYFQILTDELLREQLASALQDAVLVPDAVIDAAYTHQEQRRVAETLFVPNVAVPEGLAPTDEELESVLQTHEVRFRSPEYREISLIQLNREAFAEEIEIADDEVAAAFESRRDQFDEPERRSFEQVIFTDEATARQALGQMKDGQDFAYAGEQVSGQAPVTLGPFSQDELTGQLPELAEAVFALVENTVSEPVESPFGWHLLRVTALDPAHSATLEEVRDTLAADLALEAATDVQVSLANKLDDELAAGFPMEEAAGALGIELAKIDAVGPQGETPEGEAVEGLPPLGDLLPVLLRTNAGETSLLTETQDGNYFVVRVDSVTPSRPRPLAEVRDDVLEIWRAEKSTADARNRAETFAELARGGQTLPAIAESESLVHSYTPELTRDRRGVADAASPQVVSTLFALEPNEIAVADAPGGVVVVKLAEVRNPIPRSDQAVADALDEDLSQSFEGDLVASFVESLRQEIGVEINQRAVEDAVAQQ